MIIPLYDILWYENQICSYQQTCAWSVCNFISNLGYRVKESCYLLTLKLGDALLLKSTLFEALHTLQSSKVQDPIATVQEQGIFRLTPEEAELVLSRRNDLLRC